MTTTTSYDDTALAYDIDFIRLETGINHAVATMSTDYHSITDTVPCHTPIIRELPPSLPRLHAGQGGDRDEAALACGTASRAKGQAHQAASSTGTSQDVYQLWLLSPKSREPSSTV
jgi:hypothetical protein